MLIPVQGWDWLGNEEPPPLVEGCGTAAFSEQIEAVLFKICRTKKN